MFIQGQQAITTRGQQYQSQNRLGFWPVIPAILMAGSAVYAAKVGKATAKMQVKAMQAQAEADREYAKQQSELQAQQAIAGMAADQSRGLFGIQGLTWPIVGIAAGVPLLLLIIAGERRRRGRKR